MADPAIPLLVDKALAGLPAHGAAMVVRVGEGMVARSKGRLPRSGRVTASTVMYAASLTKQLIAALVVQAIDEQRLAYEMPVAGLVPLPAWADRIRVHHLLHHTSGLPEVTAPAVSAAGSNAEVVARLRASSDVTAAPGQRFAYCNTGYVVLAIALEQAFGESVLDLAQRRIFEPLEMTNSALNSATLVDLGPEYPHPPGTVGDGGWWTSAADLGIWLQALNQDEYWSAVASRMQQPGALEHGELLEYAWGVRVTMQQGRRTVTHGGGWPGWLSKSVRLPEQKIAVALLAQADDEQAISEAAAAVAAQVAPLTSHS
jgi:CubicO group peptidase (beta-lactamase class C family)